MFRRSRFSVRPNVVTSGRTATPQQTPTVSQDASESSIEASEVHGATDVADTSDVIPSGNGDANEPSGEEPNSAAALQRRKRVFIKPKVAPVRLPPASRTPKFLSKAGSTTPVEVPGTNSAKPSSQAGTSAIPSRFLSPGRRRASENKPIKVQSDLTPVSSQHLESLPVEKDKNSLEQPPTALNKNNLTEKRPFNLVKDRQLDKVTPSLPDKETSEISEKAKTLLSSNVCLSLSPSALSLSRLLNSPSDVKRLIKAQKVRELLKEQRSKDRKLRLSKLLSKEFSLDPTKMTMRDLIHYLPTSNPMMSTVEGSAQKTEAVVAHSPEKEHPSEPAQEPEVSEVQPGPVSAEGEEAPPEVVSAEEEEEDEALMVPQVKVAEDGSLIIDEESLTVEVQRAKGPNLVKDRDPIFERGSTTTYSSFKKASYSKPWSIEETDMFFLAISMVGTDFSLVCKLFPHRGRSEIKNKFKKEERENSWRIDKAFRERRKLDTVYFSKLLDKVLEFQRERKNVRSRSKAKPTDLEKSQRKAKAKGKKGLKNQSGADEEEEAQKENGQQCNEGAARPVKKNTRKKKADASTKEPRDKKNKTDLKGNEQSEAGIPEESEEALQDDHTNTNGTVKTPNKPARLRRAAKPLVPPGSKSSKTPSFIKIKQKESATKDESEKAVDEQGKKDEFSLDPDTPYEPSDNTSSEDDLPKKPQKPTRYGRVPILPQPLNYAPKDDQSPSALIASPSKSKRTVKGEKSSQQQEAQKSKKSKLVTLVSSKSDFSDDEEEILWVDEDGQGNLPKACGSRDAFDFLPESLHTPNHEISEVEQSIVEVVLDSPSAENTEGFLDESYNEAAQTLLTIGSLAHVSQTECDTSVKDCTAAGSTLAAVKEIEEEILSAAVKKTIPDALADFDPEPTETSSVNLQSKITDHDEMNQITQPKESCEQEAAPQPQSNQKSLFIPDQRFSTVNPESSHRLEKTSQPAAHIVFSNEREPGEKRILSQKISQADDSPSNRETVLNEADSDQVLLNEKTSTSEMNLIEKSLHSESGISTEGATFDATAAETGLNKPSVSDSALAETKTPFDESTPHGDGKDKSDSKSGGDLRDGQKKENTTGRTNLSKRSRLSKVKPNLQRTSKTTESQPQTFPETVAADVASQALSTPSLTSEYTKTETRVNQTGSVEAKTGATVTEIQNLSTVQLEPGETEPNAPFTDENRLGNREPTEIGSEKAAVTPIQENSNIDSALTHERAANPDEFITSQDDRKSKRSRLQRIKAKPKLPQTLKVTRTQTEVIERPAEEDAGSNLQQTSFQLAEKQSEILNPAPVNESLAAVGEVNKNETMTLDLEVAQSSCKESLPAQEQSDNVTMPAAHKPNVEAPSTCLVQKLKPKPNLPQTSRAGRSKPRVSEESVEKDLCFNPKLPKEPRRVEGTLELVSQVEMDASTSPNQAATGAQCRPESGVDVDSAADQETVSNSTTAITPAEQPDVPQNDNTAASVSVKRRNRFQKAKPNLAQRLKSARSKPESPKRPADRGPDSSPNPQCEKTVEMETQLWRSSPDLAVLDVDTPTLNQDATVERTGFEVQLKTKPESPKDTITEIDQSETQTSNQVSSPELSSTPLSEGESSAAEEKPNANVEVRTSDCPNRNSPQKRCRLPKLKPKPNLSSPSRITVRNLKADDCSRSLEDQRADVSSGSFEESGGGTTEKTESAVDKVSTDQPAEMASVSCEEIRNDASTSSSNQSLSSLNAAPDVQSSPQNYLSGSENPPLTSSSTSQPDSPVQSTNRSTPELTDSPKSSSTPSQIRRGRLVKPKPNLQASGRPQQTGQKQNTLSAESEDCSQAAVPVDEKHEPDLRAGQQGSTDTLSVAGSSSSGAQMASAEHFTPINMKWPSSTEEIDRIPLLSQVASEQVPSDPDEPFFVLSLVEVPYVPTPDWQNGTTTSEPQPTLVERSTGEEPSVVEDEVTTQVTAPLNEDGGDDQSPQVHPVASPGISPVQSETLTREVTDVLPSEQKETVKAKQPVKSNPRKKKQKNTGATETQSSSSSDHPESSVPAGRPRKKSPPSRKQTGETTVRSQTVGKSRQKRKGEDLSLISDAKTDRPGNAAPKKAKRKTHFAAEEQTSKLLSSVSHDVSPTQPAKSTSVAQSLKIDQKQSSVPSSSSTYTRKTPASQEVDGSSSSELEPTAVSQLFFEDIFIEINETENSPVQSETLTSEVTDVLPSEQKETVKAKQPVKSNPRKKKQKNTGATETQSSSSSDHPESSVPAGRPRKKSPPSRKQTGETMVRSQTVGKSRQKRKGEDLSLISDAKTDRPGNAAPKKAKRKTHFAAEEQSSKLLSSASHDVSPTQPAKSTSAAQSLKIDQKQSSVPSSSSTYTRKTPASQEVDGSSSSELEPTAVSQLFFEDIFIEVEDN